MKKLLTCLFVAMFVVGLTLSGLGCAENQAGAQDTAKKCPADCKKPCCEKKADGKCPPTCPKAAAAAKDAGAAQPAPAPKPTPAPAPAPAKAAPAPAPQEKK
jgi:hypothetical protein